MFERYTEEARRVLAFSRLEATRLGDSVIDPGHLLLGLLSLKTGLVKRTLAQISINQIREEIAPGADRHAPSGTATGEIPFSDDAKRALQDAADEAEQLGRGFIGAEHLLLALLRAEPTAALLQRYGVRLDDVRAIVVRQAQEPIVFTVDESPDPELGFTAYDPAVHPAFAFLLSLPPLAGTLGHAAVLTNLASRRIRAVVAQWTVTDPVGVARTTHVVRDDYFAPRRLQSLDPGAQMLATASGFHQPISGPHVCWTSTGRSRAEHDAAAITVALDSAVFEDGRVIGADAYDIARYVHGRYAAASEFVRQVAEAEAAGKDVDALLTALAKSAGDRPEHRSWRWQWAMQARRSRSLLESLRDLPEPPRFWR